MNIEKADYGTIVKFGNLEDFQRKIKLNNDNVGDIVNWRDEKGISILESSIVSRKFEISKYLLSNGANVNIVSKIGNNEFHFLASNINCEGAVEIGQLLLERGTSLVQKETQFGNTALLALCLEALKKRSEDVMAFLGRCFEKITDIDEQNNSGYSIRKLIEERGTEEMKRWMERK